MNTDRFSLMSRILPVLVVLKLHNHRLWHINLKALTWTSRAILQDGQGIFDEVTWIQSMFHTLYYLFIFNFISTTCTCIPYARSHANCQLSDIRFKVSLWKINPRSSSSSSSSSSRATVCLFSVYKSVPFSLQLSLGSSQWPHHVLYTSPTHPDEPWSSPGLINAPRCIDITTSPAHRLNRGPWTDVSIQRHGRKITLRHLWDRSQFHMTWRTDRAAFNRVMKVRPVLSRPASSERNIEH